MLGGHLAGQPLCQRRGQAGPSAPREGAVWSAVGGSEGTSPPLMPWPHFLRNPQHPHPPRGSSLMSGAGWSWAWVRTERGPPRPARRRGWQGSQGNPRCSPWIGRNWVRSLPAPSWVGARRGLPRAQGPSWCLGTPGWRGEAGGQGGSAGRRGMGGHRRGCPDAVLGTALGLPGLHAPVRSCPGLPTAGPRRVWVPPSSRRGRWLGPFPPKKAHLQQKQRLSQRPPSTCSPSESHPASRSTPGLKQEWLPHAT